MRSLITALPQLAEQGFELGPSDDVTERSLQ